MWSPEGKRRYDEHEVLRTRTPKAAQPRTFGSEEPEPSQTESLYEDSQNTQITDCTYVSAYHNAHTDNDENTQNTQCDTGTYGDTAGNAHSKSDGKGSLGVKGSGDEEKSKSTEAKDSLLSSVILSALPATLSPTQTKRVQIALLPSTGLDLYLQTLRQMLQGLRVELCNMLSVFGDHALVHPLLYFKHFLLVSMPVTHCVH